MPVKAVFVDMDGTLLNEQHRISDYTASVLHRLKSAGVFFIVVTGRPYAEVFFQLRDCHLEPDFIITSNGARIHDSELKLVRQHNVKPELAAALAQIRTVPNPDNENGKAAPKKFATNVYRNAEWLTDKTVPEALAAFHKEFKCTDLGDGLHELTAEDLEGVHEVWFLGEHKDLEPLEALLKHKYKSELCCHYSLPYLLDCVPIDVAKGNGVREVAEVLGVPLEDIACFGDGMNDESMLQIAGKAYVMENGQQSLKDVVAHAVVIDSNANDGVAKKLAELFFSS